MTFNIYFGQQVLSVLATLIGGIGLHYLHPFPWQVIIGGLGFSTICISYFLFNNNYMGMKISAYLLCFFAGAFQLIQQECKQWRNQKILNGGSWRIKAYVEDKQCALQKTYKELLTIRIISMINQKTNQLHFPSIKLAVFLRTTTPLSIGDYVIFKHSFPSHLPPMPSNAKRSYEWFLMKEGVTASIFLPHARSLKKYKQAHWSFSRQIWHYRQTIFTQLKDKMPSSVRTFFALIFLGNKEESSAIMREQCMRWGITHMLARSGLHIVLFIMFWNALLCMLPLTFLSRKIILTLFTSFYSLLSWPSISFIRAFIIFLLLQLGSILKQPTHTLYLLSLVCFIILLFNPIQLFFLDFQLTFGLTFILLLFGSLPSENHHKSKDF